MVLTNFHYFIIVSMYSYKFLITIRITYEELCTKFSSILIGPKKIYRHFKNKYSEKLKISVVYK
ncbi:hypothetical protein FWK35_00007183 [Aphis craccivora]|uniref:Uncharacterized protein n=1 Tax=Aphis craccivora TaxID=307492 RepID=A0A6G0YY29_APHCR|nr:hypothetical protein FWK35_00007183 [Aphis craccivora]